MGWLIALLILVLLAWLPLGATARYNAEGFFLKVIAGPIRILILPKKKKADQKKKTPQKKKTAQAGTPAQKNAAQPKKESGGPVTDFLPIVKTLLDLLNAFRKKLRINHLQLKLVLAGGDPYSLAMNYGRAWAAMGNLLPKLEQWFVIKKRDIEVACDFVDSKTTVIAHMDISITLGRLLTAVCKFAWKALRKFLQIKKKRKGGAVNEPDVT